MSNISHIYKVTCDLLDFKQELDLQDSHHSNVGLACMTTTSFVPINNQHVCVCIPV